MSTGTQRSQKSGVTSHGAVVSDGYELTTIGFANEIDSSERTSTQLLRHLSIHNI